MIPLAYRIRPTKLEDVVGQEHLVNKDGIIRRMVDESTFFSFILYGPPGCGKTTIAQILSSYFSTNSFNFNASVDNKAKLKDIATCTNYYDTTLVVVDEIHRMKKDTQDFLLPYLESGKIILIGLTTENPYMSINKAIRSRCHIYKLQEIKKDDIVKLLKKVLITEFDNYVLSDDIIQYVANSCGNEIRTSLNMLESIVFSKQTKMENIENIIGIKNYRLDNKEDNYYDILSAFQKSIRGSDVNAALHYLARLIILEDLDIICRRLMIIAYEDIGLANPYVGVRVMAATACAKQTGLPEARISLANITVELALSPKSNSPYTALDKAIIDLQTLSDYDIPRHILNREIKGDSKLYKYPHDYPNNIVKQQYLPNSLKDKKYLELNTTGKYEKALKERFEMIDKFLND